jgi:diguanylate cyclase (GGDEF)-like protein/PAS domain S-box-containing protein
MAGEPLDQRLVFVNEAFTRHTGYLPSEALGLAPSLLQGPRTDRAELDRLREALLAQQPVRAEFINYTKDRKEFWVELDMAPVANTRGTVTNWVAVARDVSERKAAEDQIQNMAYFDPLTQLPNRLILMKRLALALAGAAEFTTRGALMFIDLDNFKTLNDTLGHAKGDLLLQQVAARLVGAMREGDTVARLGGDEFVVMMERIGSEHTVATQVADQSARKMLAALGAPYMLAGVEYYSSASIGVTQFDGQQSDVGELLKQADLAMYQAKLAGRNTLCFFDSAMQAAVTAHAILSVDLRQSLREERFELYYQPQVGKDGKMFGVEALLRWHHPVRGVVEPAEFIPTAEETGLVLPMGQWVLEAACKQLAEWARHPASERLSIAVNVSVRQFRHPEFVDQVLAAIKASGINPQRLKLELTETLLAEDMDVTVDKMGLLQQLGVTLALDDFGIGYSSLSTLKRLPLDQLKIDKSFVQDILHDPNDAAIAHAIIHLARSLGLSVIAEGVETEAQRKFLADEHCHCYQGFLFCAPLPIDQLEVFMGELGMYDKNVPYIAAGPGAIC